MRRLANATMLALFGACTGEPLPPIVVHLGEVVDVNGVGATQLSVDVENGSRDVLIDPDGATLVVEASVGAGSSLAADFGGVPAEGRWLRARPIIAPTTLHLTGDDAMANLAIIARGRPVGPARLERSLAWTDAALLDDRATIGLSVVMAAVSDDHHGGRLLDAWFRRFATTPHSERAGPAQLATQTAATQGPDPRAWDLDALPFTVTAVYNRLDLGPREGGCGQLRVSFASTDPIYAPFDLIFLFRQEPNPDDDVSVDGLVHCLGTARRWAQLATLDRDAWLASARDAR